MVSGMTIAGVDYGNYGNNVYQAAKKGSNQKSSNSQSVGDLIQARMNEIAEKVKNGETEQKFQIGSQSFSEKEWEKLLGKVDNLVEQVKQEQSAEKKAPYSYLAKDGIVEYNGVVFVCDYKHNALTLGNTSNKKDCLNIPLSKGGSLIVNRDNLGDLSQAIGMFSPEDVNLILRAIAKDNKVQQMQKEIEDDKNSIGDGDTGMEK